MQVAARQSAIAAGLPIIPGTDAAITTPEEAVTFCESHGVPVIFKASLLVFYSFFSFFKIHLLYSSSKSL